jgi:hypothetical protein
LIQIKAGRRSVGFPAAGTVRSRLSRARKRLSQIVEGGAAGAPA